MPLARIRTDARELALDLAEELYELGYTVETLSPGEFREGAADLEIQLEACSPNQLISLVASVGEKYKKIFLAEGVIDRLPLHAPAATVPEHLSHAPQPIAFVEVAGPVETPPPAAVIAPRVETPLPPMSIVEEPVALAAADTDPYAQQSTGRTRRAAELVASIGTTLGRAGLFVSDKVDDFRERVTTFRAEVEQRRQARAERLQLERKRAAELAAADALKRESEKVARLAAERTVGAVPVAAPAPSPIKQTYISGRVRSRLAKANATGRQLRNSPAFALKFGAAVGLVGMVLLIAYANRRAPSPVGLGELTRSTTVKQSAPFGAAEIKGVAAQVTPTPALATHTTPKKLSAKPSRPTVAKANAPKSGDDYDEPEVVVRHYSPAKSKPVINTAKDDGIKRFSDLE